MVRKIVLALAALVVVAFAASCSSDQSLTPTNGDDLGLSLDVPQLSALPGLDSLENPYTLKATSGIEHIPGYYFPDNNTPNAEKVGLDAIQLNSTETELSAVWYGVFYEYSNRHVPFLAPYSMTVNTAGNSPYWVVMADFKNGFWSAVPQSFTGESNEIEVGLEPNAAGRDGVFWFAIVAEGGNEVVVHSIDLLYPVPPLGEEYIAYQTNITASDGTRLATEVNLPLENNFTPTPPGPPFPVLLLRTPYNKSDIKAMTMSLLGDERSVLNWMAELNVCSVTQYFRGRLDDSGEYPDSDGTETLFRDHAGPDHTDAIDTIEWLEARNFYNGDLFLTGPSALGLWVYQTATQLGDRVSGIYPQVASADVGAWAARQNGCFKESNISGWLSGNDYPITLLPEIKANFSNDAYWDPVNFDALASGTNCPGYHETGWWDVNVSSTINSWKQLNQNGGPLAQGNQKLIIGPWTHQPLRTSEVGEMVFPTSPAANDATLIPDGWDGILWTLNTIGRNPLFTPPVNDVLVYFIGEEANVAGLNNKWVELSDWPPVSTENKLFLTALGGLNAVGDAEDSELSIVCNPAEPIQNIGGEVLPGVLYDAGPYNQVDLYGTPQIRNFRTESLSTSVAIAGEITVDIFFSTQAVDTDIMVKLIDQYSIGKQMLVADSAMRLSHYVDGPIVANQVYKVSFPIGDRAYVFEAGHKIGIDVQSSNYPRFAVNPGNGDDFSFAGAADIVQQNEIHFGPSGQSALFLPEYTP